MNSTELIAAIRHTLMTGLAHNAAIAALNEIAASINSVVCEAGGWIPVTERLPDVGTDCLIWTRPSWAKEPSIQVDRWDEQHECPVGWSTATVPIGPGWDGAEFDDVSHWQPLPPPPGSARDSAEADKTKAGGVVQTLPMEATREMVDAACKAFGYPGGDRTIYSRAWRVMAESAAGMSAEGGEAKPTYSQYATLIEAVENEVGMGHGAWDMVTPEELVAAVLKCAASPKAGESRTEPKPVGYVHPELLRDLQRGKTLSIALVHPSEADLDVGGDVPVYAAPLLPPESGSRTQRQEGGE